MSVIENLKANNITLPEIPPKGGLYESVKFFGNGLAYISGCGPNIGDKTYTGRISKDYSLEKAQEIAKNCVLNVVSVLKREIGDLDKVKNIVKITVFVSSDNDFFNQPQVANGASQAFMDIFGECGTPSRSAIGVNVLPGNIPIEVEALIELK